MQVRGDTSRIYALGGSFILNCAQAKHVNDTVSNKYNEKYMFHPTPTTF